jgi:transcription termination/antitermination protein NusG
VDFMKKWYIVQVFAGYENLVKADIQKRIQENNMQEEFGEILIPSAKMKQFFSATDSFKNEQLFPGYLLIEMEKSQPAFRLVATTPRVLRFLGGAEPTPLSAKEVERILAQMRGEVVVSERKHVFEVGKEVEIKEGPFAGFIGIIESIDEENEKLTVMVSIFGRMTPVELSFEQVKR